MVPLISKNEPLKVKQSCFIIKSIIFKSNITIKVIKLKKYKQRPDAITITQ